VELFAPPIGRFRNLVILAFLVMSSMAFTLGAIAKEIVVVGDSLSCGSFGKHLVLNLVNKGHEVIVYCAVSSAATHWLSGSTPRGQKCEMILSSTGSRRPCGGTGRIPKLASLLQKHRSARFVIALGTNSLMSPAADRSYRKIATMITSSGNACDWIGPPHLNPTQSRGFSPSRIIALERNLGGFYRSLASQLSGACHLIDSREATASGTPGNQTIDGVHRNEIGGKYWAGLIVRAL